MTQKEDIQVSGKIAMIRQSTNIAEYQDEGMNNLILLPYFGETDNDNWYFSTPGYSIAMNGKLKGAGKKEELALDIVRYMFGSDVMNAMADRIQSVVTVCVGQAAQQYRKCWQEMWMQSRQ